MPDFLPMRNPASPYSPTDMRAGARPGQTGTYSPTSAGDGGATNQMLPPPPSGAGGSYSPTMASPYTPGAPGSGYGGNPSAPTSAYGSLQAGPPPGMKNPTWNAVYGVWMESDPGIDINSPAAIASQNAMDSYGASFGASQMSGGKSWGYPGAQYSNQGAAQAAGPAPPYSSGGPGQNTAPPAVPPPPGASAPTPAAPAAVQPPPGVNPVPPQLASAGITPDMWKYLMQFLSAPDLGPNYSTGGQ